jgi:hypothetical protein
MMGSARRDPDRLVVRRPAAVAVGPSLDAGGIDGDVLVDLRIQLPNLGDHPGMEVVHLLPQLRQPGEEPGQHILRGDLADRGDPDQDAHASVAQQLSPSLTIKCRL